MADKRLKLPTSVAQLVIKYLLDGQPVENVLYCQKQHQDTSLSDQVSAAFDTGAADVVADRVKSWLTDHWAGLAGDHAIATELDVIWNTVEGVGPLRGNVYSSGGWPIPGTNGGTSMPNNVTVAVEMRTSLLGRSFHGRTYFVGMNSGLYDSATPNQLKAASLIDLPAVYELLRNAMADTTELITYPRDYFPLGVVSYVGGEGSTTLSPIIRDPALFTKATAFVLADPFLDSQRRRLPGHNRHH